MQQPLRLLHFNQHLQQPLICFCSFAHADVYTSDQPSSGVYKHSNQLHIATTAFITLLNLYAMLRSSKSV
jgi:hypothetical protein